MLQVTPRAKGGQPYQSKSTHSQPELVETLSDLGLDAKTSHIAQKLAQLPEKQFQQVREGTSTITKATREVVHPPEGGATGPYPLLIDQGAHKIFRIFLDPKGVLLVWLPRENLQGFRFPNFLRVLLR